MTIFPYYVQHDVDFTSEKITAFIVGTRSPPKSLESCLAGHFTIFFSAQGTNMVFCRASISHEWMQSRDVFTWMQIILQPSLSWIETPIFLASRSNAYPAHLYTLFKFYSWNQACRISVGLMSFVWLHPTENRRRKFGLGNVEYPDSWAYVFDKNRWCILSVLICRSSQLLVCVVRRFLVMCGYSWSSRVPLECNNLRRSLKNSSLQFRYH